MRKIGNRMKVTTCLLTPWSRVLLEKLIGFQRVKKFPAFYGTRRFITSSHKCLPPIPIQSQFGPIHNPHPTSWRSISVLFSHICLGLPSGLFFSGFPMKTLYTPLLSIIRSTCPAQLILLDFTTLKYLINSVVCLMTGKLPLPKPVLHRAQNSAISADSCRLSFP